MGSTRRAFRLRSKATAVSAIALFTVLSGFVASSLRWRASTPPSDPSRRQPVSGAAPIHRQLVSTALLDDPQAQRGPSPASPNVLSAEVPFTEAVQHAIAVQQAPQPSASRPQGDAVHAAPVAAASQPDPMADLSWLLPASALISESSGSDDATRDTGTADAAADQLSSGPLPVGAAPSELAAVTVASPVRRARRRPRDQQETLRRRRSQVGATLLPVLIAVLAVELAAGAPATHSALLDRVTPEERLRAFEWLFGPKKTQAPPQLSPVAAAAVAHDPACAAFYRRHPNGPRTVAVVGNGPLSDADARRIHSMDLVLRINRLNNW